MKKTATKTPAISVTNPGPEADRMDELTEYRSELCKSVEKAQTEYDKTVPKK